MRKKIIVNKFKIQLNKIYQYKTMNKISNRKKSNINNKNKIFWNNKNHFNSRFKIQKSKKKLNTELKEIQIWEYNIMMTMKMNYLKD